MTTGADWRAYAGWQLSELGALAKASIAGLPPPGRGPRADLSPRLGRISEEFGSELLARAVGLAALAELDRVALVAMRVIAAQPTLIHPSIGLCLQVLGEEQSEVSSLSHELAACGLVARADSSPACERVVKLVPELTDWLQGRIDRPSHLYGLEREPATPGRPGIGPHDHLDLVLEGPPDASDVSTIVEKLVTDSSALLQVDATQVASAEDWRRLEGWRRLLGGFGVVVTGRGAVAAAEGFRGLVVATPGVALASAARRPARIVRLEPERRSEREAHWTSLLGADPVSRGLMGVLSTLPVPRAVRPVIAESLRKLEAATPEQVAALVARYDRTTDGPLERVVPRHRSLDDLIVTPGTRDALDTTIAWLRHRERVTHEWGLRSAAGYGLGLICLFHGPPGTGKSMAAEVIAAETERPLLRIDLARVLDKYIGETEKKLKSAFDAARGQSAVLVFDEADALFAKRTDVGDARDRYANAETAYLLQLAESYDGLAILTTNNRGNLDEAFQRRILIQAGFPLPDEGERLRLWRRFLAKVPLQDDVDLGEFARRFRMSGGDIKNAVFLAALWAADEDRAVSTGDLATGVARQLLRSGYPLPKDTFGPLWALVDAKA